jgi:hypothetical protein
MLRSAVEDAACDWRDWQNVYEFDGPCSDNPLLSDRELFDKFASPAAYGVGRTIRAGTRDEFLKRLRASQFELTKILSDETGRTLDEREKELRKEFGAAGRSLISALSKIATFLAPHSFSPWDRFARRGTNKELRRRESSKFNSYAQYLTCVNQLLTGCLGGKLKDACVGAYPSPFASEHDRFHRRVLDVYLMMQGGWKK